MTAIAATYLLPFLREAWLAMALALGIFIALGLLVQALKVSGASMLGTTYWAAQALAGGVGLLLLGLFAFLGIPAIVQGALAAIPGSAGCGPIADLGTLSAMLVGGLAGLRMMKSVLTASAAAAVGGSESMSRSLMGAGEALFGMLLAAAAIPIAAHFLGAC